MPRLKETFSHYCSRCSGFFLYHIQKAVSTPTFFFVGVAVCVGWIIFETLSKHPVDSPKSFFPLLMLVLTVVGYWIESLMKVSQANQSSIAAAQMDRLEEMARDSNRRDIIIQSLVTAVDEAVDAIMSYLKREEDLNESTDLRGPNGPNSSPEVKTRDS